MNKKITQLRSQIGDAENRFGTKIDAATKENAKELGFRFLDSQQYLTQVPSDDTLVTLNAPSN